MIRLAPGLTLPLEITGEAIGILAKRGAGKTNTAVVLVEQIVKNGVQVVVLDPVGVWWGIRAAGVASEGLAVPVLGGEHGDVPLEPTAGELIANVVVDTGQSVVVDVSAFSKTQQRSFVAAFATRLYQRKATARSLLHVVLEEADEFAPQRVTAGDAPMVGAIAQLVKRGRSRGIGMTFITQRSASLNKDVLDQADVLIAMRTTGPRDRKAIEGWIEHQQADGAEDVLPSLPNLETGEAWVWNPERSILQRVKVYARSTFDSSATPEAGGRIEAGKIQEIDLAALGERIAETAERAKQNDPTELRRRIRELEQAAAAPPKMVEVEVVEVRQVPVLTGADRATLVEMQRTLDRILSSVPESNGTLAGREGTTDPRAAQVAEGAAVRRRAPATRAHVDDQASRPASASRTAPGRVSSPQQALLDALAWFEAIGVDAPRRPPLAAVAGVSSRSSGFRANVSTLSGLGLIEYPDKGRVRLTGEGRDLSNPPAAMPTREALHDSICAMVSGPQAALLRVLIGFYPEAIEREELAVRAGVSSSSSGFRANVSTLSGFELINYPSPGMVAADEVLFP